MSEKIVMSEQEAKDIIMNDPKGDIRKRIEALQIAESVLGSGCTMEQIWNWAEKCEVKEN